MIDRGSNVEQTTVSAPVQFREGDIVTIDLVTSAYHGMTGKVQGLNQGSHLPVRVAFPGMVRSAPFAVRELKRASETAATNYRERIAEDLQAGA